MEAHRLQGEEVIAHLNPATMAVGKMLGGLAIVGLILYMFGVDQIIDMLMFVAFPMFIIIAGIAMVTGGGMELWTASAMRNGLKAGIAAARESKHEEDI